MNSEMLLPRRPPFEGGGWTTPKETDQIAIRGAFEEIKHKTCSFKTHSVLVEKQKWSGATWMGGCLGGHVVAFPVIHARNHERFHPGFRNTFLRSRLSAGPGSKLGRGRISQPPPTWDTAFRRGDILGPKTDVSKMTTRNRRDDTDSFNYYYLAGKLKLPQILPKNQ